MVAPGVVASTMVAPTMVAATVVTPTVGSGDGWRCERDGGEQGEYG